MTIAINEVQLLARRDPKKGKTKVNLLGVGGVGTNLLAVLARQPGRQVLIYDHDTVEMHNLNRTRMFTIADVGRRKVTAAAEVANEISGRLHHGEVCRHQYNVEVLADSPLPPQSVTIDARDTMDVTKMHPQAWIKLAYDGGSNIGFTFKPAVVAAKIVDLGGGSSYEVVPSFFVPAALLALLAVNFMRYMNFLEITDLKAGTCNVEIDEMALSVCFGWSPEEGEGAAEARAEEGAAT
jgi:hypothetical protein